VIKLFSGILGIRKGRREFSAMMEPFLILTVVVNIWAYTFIKTSNFMFKNY
jgi:hypothetical protein